MMFSRVFRRTCIYAASAFVVAAFMALQPLLCQQASDAGSSIQKPRLLWTSSRAKHLIGLPEVKPKVNGTLSLSETQLTFTSSAGSTTIERAKIIAVSIGDERKVKGGTIGKLGRMAIPYGGGSAVATVMQAKVDLLTIEFRDAKDAYHGTVFLLPKNEAAKVQELFPSKEEEPEVEDPGPSCAPGAIHSATMKVLMIRAVGLPLPTEYKVLLYEQVLRRLQADAGFGHVFRDGDRSPAASCPSSTLLLTVNAFTKGNAALRASAGPLGTFLGATSVKYHLSLHDSQNKILLEKDLKASQRGDSESLDIAEKIAKALTKKLRKTNAHQSPV